VRPQFTVAPPQHFLYFFPEPQGHGAFRPTLGALRLGSCVKAVERGRFALTGLLAATPHFGRTIWLGASLLAGVGTPAHADRDEKCRRDIRKAEEKLEKAVHKRGEGSRQAGQRSRRQRFVVPAITYQRRIVQSRRGGNTVAVSRCNESRLFSSSNSS
jgi:hypothetical protein